MSNDTTFVKITNKVIFEEIQDLKTHVMKTNGKVKLNRWISSTALAVTLILLTSVVSGANF